jgi:hypothetical protein
MDARPQSNSFGSTLTIYFRFGHPIPAYIDLTAILPYGVQLRFTPKVAFFTLKAVLIFIAAIQGCMRHARWMCN